MLKIDGEIKKNILEGHTQILVRTTHKVLFKKFHQMQPKFQSW